MPKDLYLTVNSQQRAEIKRKNSKFIAFAYPINNEEERKRILDNLRKEYRDASHICYAYLLREDNYLSEKYDDAGEPAQSAGPPILNKIKEYQLVNVMVAVIRYFGGTKLGIGGLIRAYSDSTDKVLSEIKVVKKIISSTIKFKFPYSETGAVMNILNRYEAKIIDNQYSDVSIITLKIAKSRAQDLINSLTEVTGGQVEFCDIQT